jgi:ribosomal protein L15
MKNYYRIMLRSEKDLTRGHSVGWGKNGVRGKNGVKRLK